MFSSKKIMAAAAYNSEKIRILTQPEDQTTVNRSATFSVVAEHVDGLELNYQWQEKDVSGNTWADLPQENSSELIYILASYEQTGNNYRVVLSSADGSIKISDEATLTVPPAPIRITQQPVDQVVAAGETATFSISAESTSEDEITGYEWEVWEPSLGMWFLEYEDLTPVGNSPTITVPNVSLSMNGSAYRCNVEVGFDYLTSEVATLTVPSEIEVQTDGNQFLLNGLCCGIALEPNRTYTFNTSHPSNAHHPLRFSLAGDGVHEGGNQYTTGVSINGTPGQSGSYVRLDMAAVMADLGDSWPGFYFYCHNHPGMGGYINILSGLRKGDARSRRVRE